jgi:hypothetical protein
MVLPVGHAQTLRAGRRIRTRERWILRGLLAAIMALLIAVVIAFTAGGRSSAHGCIHAVLPAATGAQEINQCGGAARATCASAARPGNFTVAGARSVASQCRLAGLAVGR